MTFALQDSVASILDPLTTTVAADSVPLSQLVAAWSTAAVAFFALVALFGQLIGWWRRRKSVLERISVRSATLSQVLEDIHTNAMLNPAFLVSTTAAQVVRAELDRLQPEFIQLAEIAAEAPKKEGDAVAEAMAHFTGASVDLGIAQMLGEVKPAPEAKDPKELTASIAQGREDSLIEGRARLAHCSNALQKAVTRRLKDARKRAGEAAAKSLKIQRAILHGAPDAKESNH